MKTTKTPATAKAARTDTKIEIKNRWSGTIIFEGDFSSLAECVKSALSKLPNLRSADLLGADLRDADLCGKKIKSMKVFAGLYRYQVFSVLDTSGNRFVKMGCLFYSLPEWDKIGILKSNLNEFPDDGSRKSIERKEAFEFAKNAALNLE